LKEVVKRIRVSIQSAADSMPKENTPVIDLLSCPLHD